MALSQKTKRKKKKKKRKETKQKDFHKELLHPHTDRQNTVKNTATQTLSLSLSLSLSHTHTHNFATVELNHEIIISYGDVRPTKFICQY